MNDTKALPAVQGPTNIEVAIARLGPEIRRTGEEAYRAYLAFMEARPRPEYPYCCDWHAHGMGERDRPCEEVS